MIIVACTPNPCAGPGSESAHRSPPRARPPCVRSRHWQFKLTCGGPGARACCPSHPAVTPGPLAAGRPSRRGLRPVAAAAQYLNGCSGPRKLNSMPGQLEASHCDRCPIPVQSARHRSQWRAWPGMQLTLRLEHPLQVLLPGDRACPRPVTADWESCSGSPAFPAVAHLQFRPLLCSTLYSTILYNTMQYVTILCNTISYCTV